VDYRWSITYQGHIYKLPGGNWLCKNKKHQWKKTPWPIYKYIALSAVPKKKAFDRKWCELLIRKGVHFSSIIKLGMPYRRTSCFRLLFWQKLFFFLIFTPPKTIWLLCTKSHMSKSCRERGSIGCRDQFVSCVLPLFRVLSNLLDLHWLQQLSKMTSEYR